MPNTKIDSGSYLFFLKRGKDVGALPLHQLPTGFCLGKGPSEWDPWENQTSITRQVSPQQSPEKKDQCLYGAAWRRFKAPGLNTKTRAQPCQRWNGLLVLILARLWTRCVDIFLKKSDCSAHIPKARDMLYLFLPLYRKSLFYYPKARGLA